MSHCTCPSYYDDTPQGSPCPVHEPEEFAEHVEALKPHVCPPISDELRRKVQNRAVRHAQCGCAICQRVIDGLNLILREADVLAEREGKAK